MTTTSPSITQTVATELATLHTIETELGSELFERNDAIRAALVALVACCHMVLLGPPGTGKSQLVRAISERFCDITGQGLNYFVYLLTRFTTPEELFGPVSVHGLKNDTYERIITGKLPLAQVAFLDEIFKSSSAVLNILLTILNERVFDNGTKRLQVPLVSLFGASNEMPQEAADLEALWDRFLIRLEVGYLSEGSFESLLNSQVQTAASQASTIMSQADLGALQAAAATLPIPQGILSALTKLRKDLAQDKGIIASDRRWVQCLRLLQAHALIEGRDSVEEDDLAILSHVLWSQPEQKQDITRMVSKLANPLNAKASELKDRAASIWSEAQRNLKANEANTEDAALARTKIALEALTKIKRTLKEVEVLKEQALDQGRPTKRIEQAIVAVSAIKKQVTESADF